MSSTSKSKPIRHRIDNFHRFEQVISQLIKDPTGFRLNPSPFSPETFSCRLRDAIKGYLANPDWTCTNNTSPINRISLSAVWDTVIVTHDGETVYIGPKINKPVEYTFSEPPRKALENLVNDWTATTYGNLKGQIVNSPSDDIIRSLVILLSQQTIPGPVNFTGTFNRELLNQLEQLHDIDVTDVPELGQTPAHTIVL